MSREKDYVGARRNVPLQTDKEFHLSIVIVNYKSGRFLKECLDSIYSSKDDLRFEIWLIDNFSQDGTIPRVKENFPEVNLISNDWNFGFSRAANQGIKKSLGKYLLLLNPDTRIKEGSLERLLEFMDENPEAGICGPKMIDEKGDLLYSCRSFPGLWTSISSSQSFLNRIFPQNPWSKKYLLKNLDRTEVSEVDWVSGSCLFASRKMLDKIGLLDETFFMFCEDMDLCLRAKKGGWKVYYFPLLTVTHKVGGSTSTNSLKAKLEHHRSMYYFFMKHYRPSFVLRFLIFSGLLFRLMLVSFGYPLPGSSKKV